MNSAIIVEGPPLDNDDAMIVSSEGGKMNFSEDGITQFRLTNGERSDIQLAFECASQAMNNISDLQNIPHLIEPDHDSYSCTGYHPIGGTLSSKYNKYREGFVFSNGDLFDLEESSDNFESAMKSTRSILHSLAMKAVADIESTLELRSGYIQERYGLGTSLEQFSQWHLKRYSDVISDEDDGLALGVHTDPSILSVVIHDAPEVQPGGWGLQYSKKREIPFIGDGDATSGEKTKGSRAAIEWREIPFHGHGVATIIVGAALARIMQVGENYRNDAMVSELRKQFTPVRHRVVMERGHSQQGRQRMALTYFLRPSPSSILEPLPIFSELMVAPPKRQISFGTWYSRVASRYNKSKSKDNKK